MTQINRTLNTNAWRVYVTSKFVVSQLTLGKDEFTVTPVTVPYPCRLPSPNDSIGVNTFRGNSFVKGRFSLVNTSLAPFERERGDEMATARWAVEGGLQFIGLEDINEFWCIMLKDPNQGLYMQRNHPLAPGESVVIPNQTLERNLFVLEGEVSIEGTAKAGFSHVNLSRDKEYVVTNTTDAPAFVLYFYQVTKEEFIASMAGHFDEWKLRLIPILSEGV